MIVISKTPMRISFLGGGSDLPDYFHYAEGAVLSTAINKYVHIVVNRLSDLFEYRFRISYSQMELVNHVDAIRHPLVRESLKLTDLNEPVEIHSIADIPAGTGIGSSSAFAVGLLNALNAYRHRLVPPEQLAEHAAYIEMVKLREPIGKQDHYISALGGFRLTRFFTDGSVSSEPIILPEEVRKAFFQRLMLFYTGMTRSTRDILPEQKANSGREVGRQILSRMVHLAMEAATLLQEGKLAHFGELLNEGWQLKRQMASTISNEQLDCWYENARRAGAAGGKILGAGGGGFFLFYVEPEHQRAVQEALAPLKQVNFACESRGSWIAYIAA